MAAVALDLTPHLVRELLDSIPDGVVIVDAAGTIVLANRQLERLFGHASGELLGQPIEVLIPQESQRGHVGHRIDFRAAPRVRAMGVAQKLYGKQRDGSLFPVEVALSPTTLEDGDALVIASVRDVTERNEAEDALAHARRQGLLLADRERMARDLHDTVIQELFATGMHLQATLPLLKDKEHATRISDAVDAIDATIKHVRETIFGLTADRSVELRQRIEEVVGSFDHLLATPASITLSGDLHGIDASTVAHLLPTLREALTNVAKHAQADTTRVIVSISAGMLQLEVHDDGLGFTDADLAARTGHGVSNLAERAKDLGGELQLTLASSGGSVLMWRVPIEG